MIRGIMSISKFISLTLKNFISWLHNNAIKVPLTLTVTSISLILSSIVYTQGERLGLRHISSKEAFFSFLVFFALYLIFSFSLSLTFSSQKNGSSGLPFFILAILSFSIAIAIMISLSLIYIEFATISLCILPASIIAFLFLSLQQGE